MEVNYDKTIVDESIITFTMDHEKVDVRYDLLTLIDKLGYIRQLSFSEGLNKLGYEGDYEDESDINFFVLSEFEDSFKMNSDSGFISDDYILIIVPQKGMFILIKYYGLKDYEIFFFEDPNLTIVDIVKTVYITIDDRVTYGISFGGENEYIYHVSGDNDLGVPNEFDYYQVWSRKLIEYINSGYVNEVYIHPPVI